MNFLRSVVFGFHLLCQLTKELLDAPLPGIEFLHRFTLGLGDVSEAFFLLYLFTQGFERFETRCPQAGFALGHRQVPVERGDTGVYLRDGLSSPPNEHRRIHHIDGVDERVRFLDESIGASSREYFLPVQRHLPAIELGLQKRGQAIFAVRPHLSEQVFAQAPGVLDRLGVGSLPLSEDNLALL